jgi:hypothetical protein
MISWGIGDREYDNCGSACRREPPRRLPADPGRLLTRRGDVLGPAVIGVVAVACCGLLPAVVVLVSAGGLAALLGGGVALIVAAAVAAALLAGRGRARRSRRLEDGS